MQPPSALNLRSSRRAFSMVEILVTTAIMGILAAMLVGGLKGVSNKGKEAKCISNLRQISAGLAMYAGENDGNLPWSTIDPASAYGQSLGLTGTAKYMWSKQLGPYLPQRGQNFSSQQNDVFVCPAASYKGYGPKTISSTYNSSSTLFYFPASASASHMGAATADFPPAIQRKVMTVEKPMSTILVAEGKQNGTEAACSSSLRWDQALADLGAATPNETTSLDYRHNEKMNVAYVDGHVGTLFFKDRGQIQKYNWEGRFYPQ